MSADATTCPPLQTPPGVSAYAKEAVQWAVDAGLISGIGDNLVPQNGANRAQVATMLMRFAENVNQ